MKRSALWGILCALMPILAAAPTSAAGKVELLNVSYDVSRELFAQINPAFQAAWQAKTGQHVDIRQSHGGSSAQARAVSEGLQADVVTLNQETDVEFLVKTGLVSPDWSQRLPDNSAPYYSFPIFLVRAGNPKHIKDWDDLAKPGVQASFPIRKPPATDVIPTLPLTPMRSSATREIQRRRGLWWEPCSPTSRCSMPAAAVRRRASWNASLATC